MQDTMPLEDTIPLTWAQLQQFLLSGVVPQQPPPTAVPVKPLQKEADKGSNQSPMAQ